MSYERRQKTIRDVVAKTREFLENEYGIKMISGLAGIGDQDRSCDIYCLENENTLCGKDARYQKTVEAKSKGKYLTIQLTLTGDPFFNNRSTGFIPTEILRTFSQKKTTKNEDYQFPNFTNKTEL